MRKLIFPILMLICFPSEISSQLSMSEIVEDKSEMADNYYGTFKHNGEKYTGEAIAYHDNGFVKTLRNFKDGKYHGLWTEWYANGNRKFQGDRYENKGQGLTRWWFENGQLKKQLTYTKDQRQGVQLYWYPNGNIKQIRYFIDDSASGPWSTFTENGEVLDEGNDDNLYYQPFFGKNLAPKGFEETSPSITADGKTVVFARYTDWVKKVPYIAHFRNNQWKKSQLPITDTLYNLAISPNGQNIVYKKYEVTSGGEVSKTYLVKKEGSSWGKSVEQTNLYNINAGYFQFTPDGTLFMFARKPKTGIYYANLQADGEYSKPIWLSDEVSFDGSVSFDVCVHPNKDKLIITQEYKRNRQGELGDIGFYYYQKIKGVWKRIQRLPLAYGWGANVTPDGNFMFVRNGNIQSISLNEVGIDW
ncbi:MAG: hypothetical protein HKN48_09865 [Flavobacteriaceae bacterium]|nr:hypothetical protein [Flavobacteriaceae bacterium]